MGVLLSANIILLIMIILWACNGTWNCDPQLRHVTWPLFIGWIMTWRLVRLIKGVFFGDIVIGELGGKFKTIRYQRVIKVV